MDGLSDILGNLGGGSGGLLGKLSGLLGGGSGGLLGTLGNLLGGGSGGSLLDKLGDLLGGDSNGGGLLDTLKDLISGGDDAGQSSGDTTPSTGAATTPTTPGDTSGAGADSGAGSATTDEEPGWYINPPTNTTGDPNQPLTLPPTTIDPETGLQVVEPLIGGPEPGDAGDQADIAQGAYPDYILELPQRVPEDASADTSDTGTSLGEAINAAVQERILVETQEMNEGLK